MNDSILTMPIFSGRNRCRTMATAARQAVDRMQKALEASGFKGFSWNSMPGHGRACAGCGVYSPAASTNDGGFATLLATGISRCCGLVACGIAATRLAARAGRTTAARRAASARRSFLLQRNFGRRAIDDRLRAGAVDHGLLLWLRLTGLLLRLWLWLNMLRALRARLCAEDAAAAAERPAHRRCSSDRHRPDRRGRCRRDHCCRCRHCRRDHCNRCGRRAGTVPASAPGRQQ